MLKNEFLQLLSQKLSNLPTGEEEKTVDYYRELIEDMVEDGMTEENAVASLGNINDITDGVINEFKENHENITEDDFDYSHKTKNSSNNSFREKASVFYEEKVKPIGTQEVKIGKTKYPTWLIIVICVTAIVWVPLLFGLAVGAIGGGLGLLGGFFAAILALAVALITLIGTFCLVLPIGGIAFIITTPQAFITLGTAQGFVFLGSGLALIGVSILGTIAAIYLFKYLIIGTKYLCKQIMVLSRFLTKKFKEVRGKNK